MEFISNALYDYVVAHSQEEPPLLADLTRQTHLKVLQPRMLSGPLQGRFLSVLTKLLQPKRILEVGTFTGYATLCLAEGLPKDGLIDTLDKNEELVDFQRSFFDRSPWGKQIHQHCGDAIEIIPTLEGEYDLVFLDADKKNYLNYLELLFPKIKPGGLLLSDNVLWSGKVLEETQKNDRDTAVLKEFNQKLATHPNFETVLLPLRDGLTLSRKI
ncbi:MAG: O-methyltransferase [Flavobacteriaceae bacterium]|nr:O-methyltransferase [Flavobacteriaceae bacterium]